MNKRQTHSDRLGDRVRDLRGGRHLSIRGLAAAAGVDASWLMRLERGEYASPDARLLRQLAETLGVAASDLLLLAGYGDVATLPALPTYLRARYDLPDDAVAQLDAHFRLLDEKHRRRQEDRS